MNVKKKLAASPVSHWGFVKALLHLSWDYTKCIALLIAVCMLLPCNSFAQNYATRGEIANMLLEAADFYNPDVIKSDIIKGYEDGELHEDWNVTRAEALVMLKRAFGSIPEPTGHNKRTALSKDDFSDIPSWAQKELEDIFNSGIVAGTQKGRFSPDDKITKEQMELFIKRVYSLYGENPSDDFYATANKKTLEKMKIPQGEYIHGTVYNMQTNAATQLETIIQQIVNTSHKKGTKKQKMADLYRCVIDEKAMKKLSVEPIREYLDAIDGVKNISELSKLQIELIKELCVAPFTNFSLTVDFEKSSDYVLSFNALEPLMNKELYFDEDSKSQNAYLDYLETLLAVSGEKERAKENAHRYFEFEKLLASVMLDAEKQNNVEDIYNTFSYNRLEVMLPDCNLDEVIKAQNLNKSSRVIIFDVALTQKFAELYNQSNIEALKTAAKIKVLSTWGTSLDLEIEEADTKLANVIFGTNGSYTRAQRAALILQNTMPEYLGEIYVKKHFDEKSKQILLEMVYDIREVFKEKILSLEWMCTETKEKAVKKLDSMQIKIGYPDSFSTFLDDIEITSPENGGTYFLNMLAIAKGASLNYAAMQDSSVDYSMWSINPYTANAGYDLTGNSITFPAAILQSPLYDKDASYEENLGGIGYIIAHEMVHAFDSNGALFDENGNMCNWWNEDDFKAFNSLCDKVIDFYDGYEAIAAIPTDGRLTLDENVADLGAAVCITELLGKKENANYKKLFYSMANTFANTCTREYAEYASKYDNHADGKARINCVVVQLDEFYAAFDIKPGDGMYIEPEKRIKIW